MNWRLLSAKCSLLLVVGCGVKGDPMPPEKPVDLGRGRPTYKRATEGIKIEHKRSIHDEDEPEEKSDEEEN